MQALLSNIHIFCVIIVTFRAVAVINTIILEEEKWINTPSKHCENNSEMSRYFKRLWNSTTCSACLIIEVWSWKENQYTLSLSAKNTLIF